MEQEAFSDVVYSRNVIEFVTVANEFCTFIESVDGFERKEFVERLQKLLPLLYLKASLIPEIEDKLPEYVEKFVTEDDYNYVHKKLQSKFGQFDSYQEVFDPMMQYSEEPLESNLSENVADIYQDLKDFILGYRIGTIDVMNDSLFECKNNFEQYWGQRLVNGLRAIHNLVYGEADLEKEDNEQTVKKEGEDKKVESKDWILKQQFDNYKDK
jgi:hypothetical protein